LQETFREWGEVAGLIGRKARRMDRERLSRMKDIIVRARRDIEKIIEEGR
jgi:hypothetical protein